jgi:hypothetical protein
VQFNCVKKTARKTELNVLQHRRGFPSGLSVLFLSFVCLLVRVIMVDKNKAVVCCLLATLRKLWDSLTELRSSLSERLERTVLRPALMPVKSAQFTQFFRQV